MSSKTERPSLGQTRHMAYIAEFTTDIRYVKSETNIVVPALSRPSVSAIGSASVINFKELSEDKALDVEFTRLRHSTSSTLDLQLIKTFDNIVVWCDVSTGRTRPYVTAKFRRQFLLSLHGLGHPPHRATKPLINTRFVCHGMHIDVANWWQSCKFSELHSQRTYRFRQLLRQVTGSHVASPVMSPVRHITKKTCSNSRNSKHVHMYFCGASQLHHDWLLPMIDLTRLYQVVAEC